MKLLALLCCVLCSCSCSPDPDKGAKQGLERTSKTDAGKEVSSVKPGNFIEFIGTLKGMEDVHGDFEGVAVKSLLFKNVKFLSGFIDNGMGIAPIAIRFSYEDGAAIPTSSDWGTRYRVQCLPVCMGSDPGNCWISGGAMVVEK